MDYNASEKFEVLHGLAVKGLTSPEQIAESTGLDIGLVRQVLDDAVVEKLARKREGGRVSGYMLTAAGREQHAVLRADQVFGDQDGLTAAYDAFLEPNDGFKELVTRWQTTSPDDPSAILNELTAIDAAVQEILDRAATSVSRMQFYRPRFTRALESVRGGDVSALAKPMSDSYHDIWMELHEDLLQLLGRERTAADG